MTTFTQAIALKFGGDQAAIKKAKIAATRKRKYRSDGKAQVLCSGGPMHGHALAVPRVPYLGLVQRYETAQFTLYGRFGRYELDRALALGPVEDARLVWRAGATS